MQPKIYDTPHYFDTEYRFPEEMFVTISGEESCYRISDFGRVMSSGKQTSNRLGTFAVPTRILKPGKVKAGYHTVALNGKSHSVHSLMSRAFMGTRPEGVEVDHLDGDKTNNVLENLEFVTSKENKKRAKALGLSRNVGEAHGMATLIEDQVMQVLTAYYVVECSVALTARLYKIPERTVKDILSGRNWKHIFTKFEAINPQAVAKNRAQTKLTAEQAREIYRRGQTETIKDLAAEFGMSKDTVGKILSRKLWAAATESLALN